MASIKEGAQKILNQLLQAQSNHNVTIVCDTSRPPAISDSLFSAACEIGCVTTKILYDANARKGQLPTAVDDAMACSDIVICITQKTIGYSKGADRCRAHGGRIIVLTEANEDVLCKGGIEADFFALQQTISAVRERFDSANNVHVKSPSGTDLRLDIGGRTASTSPGLCLEPGLLAAIPAVEVYIPPNESKTNGVFVADVSASQLGLLEESITMTIKDGVAVAIDGGQQAEKLKKILSDTGCSASYIIAEFAIGLNPCAEPIGIISVDEGVYGTGHFALGRNLGMGGGNDSPEHLDFVYRHPTIYLDGDLFMKDGKLISINNTTE